MLVYGKKRNFAAVKRFLVHLLYICVPVLLCLTGASCRDSEDEELIPRPGKPGKKLARTLIIYMAAENSLSSFVDYDSLEIAQGLSTVGVDHRVVVYIDDTKSSRLCVGTRDEPLQETKTYSRNISSTDSADMESVLSEIVTTYPADHYGLVLWSHASGWVPASGSKNVRRTFGVDNGLRLSTNMGPVMEIATLAHVLSHLPHFDYVFFDACFMQCVEVAYQLRHVTDYVIGSPAEIPGYGAPYDNLLSALCQISEGDNLPNMRNVVNGYADYYDSGGGRPYPGAELSLVRTSALEALAAATAPHLQRLFADTTTPDCSAVQRFYYNPSQYTEYYDLQNLMYHHLSAEEYSDWLSAFMAAVPLSHLSSSWLSMYEDPRTGKVCHVNEPEYTGAVSVFVPSDILAQRGYVTAYHAFDWYKDCGLSSTGW